MSQSDSESEADSLSLTLVSVCAMSQQSLIHSTISQSHNLYDSLRHYESMIMRVDRSHR